MYSNIFHEFLLCVVKFILNLLQTQASAKLLCVNHMAYCYGHGKHGQSCLYAFPSLLFNY